MNKYTRDMFILDKLTGKVNGFWDMVMPAAIFKDEFKSDEAEIETVLSYANALNCITNELLKQNHSPTTPMVLNRNSLALPFIFLARHTVELSLKYLCNVLNLEYQFKHRLITLWDKIVDYINKYNILNNEETKEFDDIKAFIGALEELDCDGSRSRYSKDVSGKLYNPTPKFINAHNINEVVQNLLVKLVKSIIIIK